MPDHLLPYDRLPRRRPWRLVSPLGSRWLGDFYADPIRLWTTQTADAYRTLVEKGVLVGDPALAEPDFAAPYAWMQQQVDTWLPTEGPGMLWLWARRRRSEVRREARRCRGEVLLEVEMPRDAVLLSGFDAWHSVLNAGLIVAALPNETDAEWWARAEPLLDDFDARLRAAGHDTVGVQDHREWRADLRAAAEESWESIFDPSTWSPNEHVQAVAHEICAENVVHAIRIR